MQMSNRAMGNDRLSWRRWMWGALLALLLLPAIAMPFSAEVNWGVEDFAAAALMLGALGAGTEMASRIAVRPVWRMAMGAAVIAIIALIWAQAAVGIF